MRCVAAVATQLPDTRTQLVVTPEFGIIVHGAFVDPAWTL